MIYFLLGSHAFKISLIADDTTVIIKNFKLLSQALENIPTVKSTTSLSGSQCQ